MSHSASAHKPPLTSCVSDRCAQQLGRLHRPISPRSRHLPVAVVDGSVREKTNGIAVRLWTAPSWISGLVTGKAHLVISAAFIASNPLKAPHLL
jgi:hypothetical protein